MRKETDLEEVKEIATLLLWLPPQATKFSPMIVKHPFTDCGMVVLRNSQQEPKPVNILESESAFSCWREEIGKRIKQAKSVQEIYPLVTKSYTFAFLKHTADYLSQKDLSEILSMAWVNTECPNLDQNLSQRQKLALFQAADPIYLMDASEREKLERLEDEVTVYFENAAKQGNNAAEYQLGKLYLYGKEVRQNEAKAMEYLTAASEHGNTFARALLERIETDRQQFAAQRQTQMVSVCASGLFQDIARLLQTRLEEDGKGNMGLVDRKLRRQIEEKKQAQGLKHG